jgi:pyruvate kinase
MKISDFRIHDTDKLDRILVKLCELIIDEHGKSTDYGMVAACVLDPHDEMVIAINYPAGDGKRVHAETAERIRRINKRLGCHVAILQDLQGPKLRIGKVDGKMMMVAGEGLIITTKECVSTPEILYVSYDRLPDEAHVGDRILLNDGKVELVITERIDSEHLRAQVVVGGELSSNKGFNLPNTKISAPCLTEKDLIDLDFGLSLDVDWVALSFVRTADDIIQLKNIIAEKGSRARVIAKIEKPEAVENFDSIVKVTDAVMVARGDLGVEVPLQQVPLIQKRLVELH